MFSLYDDPRMTLDKSQMKYPSSVDGIGSLVFFGREPSIGD